MTNPIAPFDRAGIEQRQQKRKRSGWHVLDMVQGCEAEADLRAALQELDRLDAGTKLATAIASEASERAKRLEAEVTTLRAALEALASFPLPKMHR